MAERRWVLDAHTLVSRLLTPNGSAARAVDHALNIGVPLVSDATLAELAAALARPRLDRWVSLAERQQFIRLLARIARRIPITRQVQACRDPKDDKFLDVALNGEAQAIITGDQDLAVLDPFHGVRIVSPAVFCTLFAAGN